MIVVVDWEPNFWCFKYPKEKLLCPKGNVYRVCQQDSSQLVQIVIWQWLQFCFLLVLLKWYMFYSSGDDSSPSEPMLLFPKRTFQPSTIRRKRNHGFFARSLSVSLSHTRHTHTLSQVIFLLTYSFRLLFGISIMILVMGK